MGKKAYNEAKLNAKVVKLLNKFPRTKFRKRYAGPFKKGMADITGVSNGIPFELEGKIGNNTPTDKQAQWLRDSAAVGCEIGVYWCELDALELFFAGLKRRGVKKLWIDEAEAAITAEKARLNAL